MKVYRAENGEVIDLSLPPSTTIRMVKEHLATASQIEVNDQILLYEKSKLADERTLESYDLSLEKPIFLFNRRSLLPTAPPPKPTVLGPVEVKVPAEPVLAHILPPVVRYKTQFRSHLEYAKVIFPPVRAVF
jgi:hypothetical protein